MRYPGGPAGQLGEKIEYAYLPQSAVENIFSASNRYYYLQLAQYDAAGRVDKIHLGAPNLGSEPVLKTDYDYFAWNVPNGVGRLRSITTGTPANPTSLQNTQYYLGNVSKYDPVGNLTAIYEYGSGNPRTQQFTYDDLNRLTNATISGGSGGEATLTESYTYSGSTGNIASTTAMGTYIYNQYHPHAVASTSTGWSYQYDANGNMTYRDAPDEDPFTYKYDAENRLVQAWQSSAMIAAYVFDGDGNRIMAIEGGVTTVYIGSYYEYVDENETATAAGSLNNGIACQDAATGSGYLMYSAADMYQRFSASPPYRGGAAHFVCVKYDGGQARSVLHPYKTSRSRPADTVGALLRKCPDLQRRYAPRPNPAVLPTR